MAAIAWMTAVDAAFGEARASGKPLFMYWGASWCPPCNRTKATAFGRADFAALANSFVALHIDGDSGGAQQIADRFRLRSYPTLVVFRPDGEEVTRLPCEVDGERLVSLLRLALAAPHTSTQLLDAALTGARTLDADEWTQLAWYSWDTDEGMLLNERTFSMGSGDRGSDGLGAILGALAEACPLESARTRFLLVVPAHAGTHAGQALAAAHAMLRDAAAVRTQLDIVLNQAPDLLRALTAPDTPARTELATLWANVLASLESDLALSVADRLQALRTRIRLSLLGGSADRLRETARSRAETARLTVSEPALRHAVINSAAGVLSESGLLDEAHELLSAELPRSHAPYYFMHNLAAVAKRRGDHAAALDWYERAWTAVGSAVGSVPDRGTPVSQPARPATSLQWGAAYLLALLDAPEPDAERIARAAERIFAEVAAIPDPKAGRNRTQLQRIGARLARSPSDDPRVFALLEATRRD